MHTEGRAALLFIKRPNAYCKSTSLSPVPALIHLSDYQLDGQASALPPSAPRIGKRSPLRTHPRPAKTPYSTYSLMFPASFENLDALRRTEDVSSPSQHDQRVAMLRECWRLDRELLRWFDTYGPESQIEALRERAFRNENPVLSDVVTAHIMGIYWAVCILVYGTLRSVLALRHGALDETALLPNAPS